MPNLIYIYPLFLLRKTIYTLHTLFLFVSSFFRVHTSSLSFSPQSLSLQFHFRGIETAAGASSGIDKTMAIAASTEEIPNAVGILCAAGGMVFTYIESCAEITFTSFRYATNVSLAISQARQNPLVTRPNASRLL